MVPDSGLLLYCGVCILIVVIFCCCFHVTELIKLGFLRKLTRWIVKLKFAIRPHRYSLGGVSSTEFFDNDSRTSTRRNTAIVTTSTDSPPSSSGGDGGNFSIITVFTYTPVSQDSQERSNKVSNSPTKKYIQEALTRELSPERTVPASEPSSRGDPILIPVESTGNRNNGNDRGGYDNENQKDFKDEPPNYDALFPKLL